MPYGFTQNEFILLTRIADNLGRIADALETHNEEVASRYTVLSTLETINCDTPATPGGREEQ